VSILRELEKLIQQVAEQQQPQSPARRRPVPQEIEVLDEETAEVIEADVIDAQPLREDVAAHVAHRMDTSDLGEHAARLGASVEQADEKLESHLHDKFDHDVGGLAARTAEAQAAAGISSSEIAKMLRNPVSIRQAVILSEILARPADRW
jgi:hypothetical protein